MEMKIKKLSKNEKYACRIKTVKEAFRNDTIFVSFGYLRKTFNFDSSNKKPPIIAGSVICSVLFNRRLNINTDIKLYLCFYVIRDDNYTEPCEQEFCDTIIPQIKDWINKIDSQPDTSLPGVEELLIEWTGQELKVHQCRYK